MTYRFLFGRSCDKPAKVAFLDRDGVINCNYDYVWQRSDFDFVPGVLEGCRLLSQKGYQLVLTTNQSGIGRGMYSIFDFAKLTYWLAGVFAHNHSPLSAVYFCPHHPEKALGDFLQKCHCRKPEPGMILAALDDFNIDLGNSLFIGDKNSDMKAAFCAGIPNRYLVQSDGILPLDQSQYATGAFTNLLEVARSL